MQGSKMERGVARLLTLIPAATAALSLYAVDLPLFVESPGSARSVIPLIDIDGTPTYDTQGRLLLTTVNVGRVNAYDAVRGWLDPSAAIVPEEVIVPEGQTDEEYDRESLSQMDQSKIAAAFVALDGVDGYPENHGPGVIVYGTEPGTPASGRLFPGDVIVGANGEQVVDFEDLGAAIDAAGVGGDLELSVHPLEGGEFDEVTLRPVLDPETGGPYIGTYNVPNFPVQVRIESGQIGGPSAGLMWAVGMTELLTDEDLVGSAAVAGTGTVDLEGNVGPIGGIRMKIAAAARAGAEAFLVPQDNLAEARGADADIRLVAVQNVDQAISFLEAEG